MTTDRFPILSLSPGIFDRISGALNWDELLEFSQCSESSEQFVKTLFADQDTSDVIFDVELTSRPSIYVSGHNSMNWKFYGKRSGKRLRYSELETKSLKIPDCDSGTVKTLVFHVKRENWNIGFHDSIKDVILLAKHLAELFNLSIRVLTIDAEYLDILEIILSIEQFKYAKEVQIRCGSVSNEEMRRVSEGFRSESVSFFSGMEKGFKFDGVFCRCCFRDAEEQSNTNTSRFELSLLQPINCHHPHLSPITWNINEEVNQLLHLWCAGTNTKLKEMYFAVTRYSLNDEEGDHCYEDNVWENQENWDEENFEFEKVIQGLERFLLPDDDNSISGTRRRIPVIQRKTDGMKMSVDVKTIYMDTMCTLKPFFHIYVDKTAERYANFMRDSMKSIAEAFRGNVQL